jgi:hypothetical protein
VAEVTSDIIESVGTYSGPRATRRSIWLEWPAALPTLLLTASLAVWLVAVRQTPILTSLQPTVTAYAEALPPIYWIALALAIGTITLRLYFLRGEVAGLLDLSLITLLVLLIYGTASVLQDTPRFFDSYSHYADSVLIATTGEIDFPQSGTYVGETPGAFTLFAVIQMVSGVPHLDLLLWYPVASHLVIGVLLYLIARAIGLGSGAIVAPAVFLSAGWYEELHVSPQSVGLALYCVILLCFAKVALSDGRENAVQWRLLAILAILATVISHPGTPIFIAFTLGAISLAILITARETPRLPQFLRLHGLSKGHFAGLLMIATIMFLAWQAYIASGNFFSILRKVESAFLSAFNAEAPVVSEIAVNWHASYSALNYLRGATFFAVAVLAMLVALQLWRKGDTAQRRRISFLVASFAGCATFVAIPLFTGGTYVERGALFSLLSISLLLAAFFWTGRRASWFEGVARVVVLAVIGVLAGLMPITRHGGDAFQWPSAAELAAADFGISRAVTGSDLGLVSRQPGPLTFYNALYGTQEEVDPEGTDPPYNERLNLVLSTPTGAAYARLRAGQPEEHSRYIRELTSENDRIYDSGSEIYWYYVRPVSGETAPPSVP